MEHTQQNKNTCINTISVTARGTGYVTCDGYEQDIEIAPEQLGVALNNDTVEVQILPEKSKGRVQGRVDHVVKRSKTKFAGTLERKEEGIVVVTDDKRMHHDVRISEKDAEIAPPGHKVIVEIGDWTDPQTPPHGTIDRVLGESGAHEVEMQAIVIENGFDLDFPEDVTNEAIAIAQKARPLPEDEIARRRDMRGIPTFTIDPDDAKDFDDALSVNPLDNGHVEIGVHIADVSHYVREGTELDREARARGFSVYLVDRTIPMLPLELSTDICSLNPEEDRFAFSAIFEMDKSGTIHSEWFGKTVIRSDKRFAYEDAQRMLDAKDGEYITELTTLNTIAHALRTAKFEAGAIDFETEEIEFVLDSDGKPIKVYKKERLDAHKLIEEFMLLANRRVAELMYKAHNKKEKTSKPGQPAEGQRGTFIYRIHDLPNAEKLANLGLFMRALGHDHIDLTDNNISSKHINEVLRTIANTPEESLIKTAAIRSMSKAVYSTKNLGHFGLGFQYYTHFTSPIRRYADLLVHRMLMRHLEGNHMKPDELARYESMASDTTEKEIAAAQAERESIKYKQVEYMTEHIGETFTATISGVVEYGIYVQEFETHAEGLVHVSKLGDDYYEYNEKKFALVGQKTKNAFTLGDTVQVKLIGADMDQRQLDFALADEEKNSKKNVSKAH